MIQTTERIHPTADRFTSIFDEHLNESRQRTDNSVSATAPKTILRFSGLKHLYQFERIVSSPASACYGLTSIADQADYGTVECVLTITLLYPGAICVRDPDIVSENQDMSFNDPDTAAQHVLKFARLQATGCAATTRRYQLFMSTLLDLACMHESLARLITMEHVYQRKTTSALNFWHN